MKKILLIVLMGVLLVGCSCSKSTARGAVEAFLDQYRNLSASVIEDMDDVIEKEENLKLRNSFKDLNELNYDVTHCFMLELYNDYYNEKITTDIFIKILNLIQSYLVRRQICNIPANSLNKTFAGLHDEINPDDYFNSFKFALIEKDTYKRFPNTSEFKENLQMKDIYNSRIRAYVLRKLENYESKEPINVESFTIEHIMPQNPNLSDDWKFELGANWEEVQKSEIEF